MAGVRGVKNPMPKKGGKPTGMFSSKGKQKLDPLVGDQSKHAKYTGAKYRKPRTDPVKRNNGLK